MRQTNTIQRQWSHTKVYEIKIMTGLSGKKLTQEFNCTNISCVKRHRQRQFHSYDKNFILSYGMQYWQVPVPLRKGPEGVLNVPKDDNNKKQ